MCAVSLFPAKSKQQYRQALWAAAFGESCNSYFSFLMEEVTHTMLTEE
jgi:hypothetical protein